MSETAKIRDIALPYCEGCGIDLGCGAEKIRREAIGIDAGMDLIHANIQKDWRDLSAVNIKQIVTDLHESLRIPYGEHTLDFGAPFERLSMREAVVKYSDLSDADLEPDKIDTALKKQGIKPKQHDSSWGQKLVLLFEECAESKLIQPTFITDFPVEISPLAKRDPKNPAITTRFELFVAGMELANGFNELNDPFDQAERFRGQAESREAGDDEAHYYDAEYITALEHALPPTVGAGMGIDRLVMLLTNADSIRDVILFPTLRRKDN